MAPDKDFESMFKSEDMARRYKSAEVVTGAFARVLVEKAGLLEPSPEPTAILDNACGTGVVAAALFELLDRSTKDRMELTCGDFSDSMIKSMNERIEASGWEKVTAKNVDAQVSAENSQTKFVMTERLAENKAPK